MEKREKMTKRKILVVDDDDQLIALVKVKLEKTDRYSVIYTTKGVEAAEMATSEKPDLILLDVMMPGKDGFDVASKLQANKQTKDIPIVMVTALGEVKDRVKALESGADDFLTKPVDKTELLTRVKTLVEKAERIRQLIVPKKRPLVSIVSIIVAVIAAIGINLLRLGTESRTYCRACSISL